MAFIIETFDKPGHADLRSSNRDRHLEYLDTHKALLIACGAKLNDDGSGAGGGLYVVDLDTREQAEAFIQADPFSTVGLFERIVITRWRKAYVDGRSHL
ncbi:YciI family protein [Xylophilus sp. Kf1]|nr:YciI family protein [Xylophilus sp. Kf1]